VSSLLLFPLSTFADLNSTYQLFITIGIFVANCVSTRILHHFFHYPGPLADMFQINFGTEKRNDTGSWRIPMGISFLWVLILGLGISLFPESPRYDFRHGRVERAQATMSKLYGVSADHPFLIEELAEIRAKHEEELLHKNQKWYEMFTAPRMAYRLALGVTLQALQQLTGANYL
jgi:SP family sugar:H+ symporter-like MFS transporter